MKKKTSYHNIRNYKIFLAKYKSCNTGTLAIILVITKIIILCRSHLSIIQMKDRPND
jgi:hypothetical protein